MTRGTGWIMGAGALLAALAVAMGARSLGMVTPLGGLLLIAGWTLAAWRMRAVGAVVVERASSSCRT